MPIGSHGLSRALTKLNFFAFWLKSCESNVNELGNNPERRAKRACRVDNINKIRINICQGELHVGGAWIQALTSRGALLKKTKSIEPRSGDRNFCNTIHGVQ